MVRKEYGPDYWSQPDDTQQSGQSGDQSDDDRYDDGDRYRDDRYGKESGRYDDDRYGTDADRYGTEADRYGTGEDGGRQDTGSVLGPDQTRQGRLRRDSGWHGHNQHSRNGGMQEPNFSHPAGSAQQQKMTSGTDFRAPVRPFRRGRRSRRRSKASYVLSWVVVMAAIIVILVAVGDALVGMDSEESSLFAGSPSLSSSSFLLPA